MQEISPPYIFEIVNKLNCKLSSLPEFHPWHHHHWKKNCKKREEKSWDKHERLNRELWWNAEKNAIWRRGWERETQDKWLSKEIIIWIVVKWWQKNAYASLPAILIIRQRSQKYFKWLPVIIKLSIDDSLSYGFYDHSFFYCKNWMEKFFNSLNPIYLFKNTKTCSSICLSLSLC
jgi:hypothetical protein